MLIEYFQDREVLWAPNPGPQTTFLASPAREVFYGGAAAGGKSDAIIAGAIRHADHPLHRAILFRRTRPQLQEVIDRTRTLYPLLVPGAEWVERESRWRLPAGGFVQMGFAEHEKDILGFKTFEYNYIGFDELTSFTRRMYLYMFSRNRTKSKDLPPMMRSASNPGDVGHEWVFERFIKNRVPYKIYEEKERVTVGRHKYDTSITRQFIPAAVSDNPKLPDKEAYIAGLVQMGEEGQAYLYGVWVRQGGMMFKKTPQEVPARLESSNYYTIMSFDYGLNDPNAVYWHVVYPGLNKIDTVGELYVNEVDLDSLAEQIREKEKSIGLKPVAYRVADPKIFSRESDKQSIATKLAERGLAFEKANNDRVSGWAEMQRRIYGGSWRVWEGRAPELLRTIETLVKHPTRPDDIKERGQEDHPADSNRYALMSVYDNLGAGKTQEADNHLPPGWMQDTEFDKVLSEASNSQGRAEFVEGLGEW